MNLREQSKADTRAAVIAAAERIFAEAGYEAATIRLIAARARLSTGALFSSFTGKAALYREIYGHEPVSPEEGRLLKTEVERLRAMLALAAVALNEAA